MRRSWWLLTIDLALVAVVALGVTGFASSDKVVTLSVDGAAEQVRTFGGTVEELLAEQDVVVSDRDLVVPSLETSVADGDAVTVRLARQLKVLVDGEPRQIWTTALTVDEAVSDLTALSVLGSRAESAEVSVSRSQRLPLTGYELAIQLPDQVTLFHDGNRTVLVTAAPTVAAALREAGVQIRPRDHLNVSLSSELRAGMKVRIVRVDVGTSQRVLRLSPDVVRRPDASMYEGQEKVLRAGDFGKAVATYRVTRHDGAIVKQRLIDRRVVESPASRVVLYGTKERPYSAPSTGAEGLNWAALAQCESGGNPRAVNPAGYYGLYQFALSTWYSVGGTGNPIDASADEQTYRAQVLYSRSGASPWPVCGPLLFS